MMTREDFFKLHIGQKIWIHETENIIESLRSINELGKPCLCITFNHDPYMHTWENLKEEVSKNPPKKTKRYWAWRILNRHGNWLRTAFYLDDDGILTEGCAHYCSADWSNVSKIKIEDDFVDVEVV